MAPASSPGQTRSVSASIMMRFHCRGKRARSVYSSRCFMWLPRYLALTINCISPDSLCSCLWKKEKDPGFYLSVFPVFSLITEWLFLSRPWKRAALFFNSFSIDEDLLSDRAEAADLCSAAAAGNPTITSAERGTFSPPFICLSAGEITPNLLNVF